LESPTAKVYAEIRGEYIANTAKTLAMAAVNTGRKMNADQIYQPGTNTLPMYADGLKQLAETEYNVVSPVFRREEWERVCAATMRQPIQEFGKTLRDLNAQIQSNIMTDCFLAYEIIGIVQRLAMDLERIFDIRQPIMDALRPVRDTAKLSMSGLLSGIRDSAASLATLPADGAAIPLTAEVMTKLQTMTRLLDPVTSVLRDLGDGGWAKSVQSLDVQPNGEQLFANYARDFIETLLNSLDNRGRALLRSTAVQGVFMVNNIAIINRMIQSSDLLPLLQSTAPRLIEPMNKRFVKRYMDEWQGLCRLLFDQQNTRAMRPSSGGTSESAAVVKALSSKEKEAIKIKFSGFNKDFDDLVAKHRNYNLEREVRVQFAKEISSMIEPLYRRFYDKYFEIDKGKGKYVKYDKNQMSSVLAGLG
jgi:exocyst complex protein 7